MKNTTSAIVCIAAVVVAVGGSLLFRHLTEQTRLKTEEEKQRLAALLENIAAEDSLRRVDSLNVNIITADLAYHNLHGRVRQMNCGEIKATFDRNGNWTNPQAYISRGGYNLVFERNKFDRIIAARSSDSFEGEAAEKIEYVWDGDLIKKVISNGCDGKYTIQYTYDHHNLPVSARTVSSDDSGESEVVTTYTYDRFDKYGNWTQRTARSAIKTTQYDGFYDDENDTFITGGEPIMDSSEEVERRSITYYN